MSVGDDAESARRVAEAAQAFPSLAPWAISFLIGTWVWFLKSNNRRRESAIEQLREDLAVLGKELRTVRDDVKEIIGRLDERDRWEDRRDSR